MSGFTGDTRIALIGNQSISFKELIKGIEEGKTYYGYTVAQTGRITAVELRKPYKTKQVEHLSVMVMNNAETILCSPTQDFLSATIEIISSHDELRVKNVVGILSEPDVPYMSNDEGCRSHLRLSYFFKKIGSLFDRFFYSLTVLLAQTGDKPFTSYYVAMVRQETLPEPEWLYQLNTVCGYNFALAAGPFVTCGARNAN